MKTFLLAASLGVGALLLHTDLVQARPHQAPKTKRLSVLDYYFLLPCIGNVRNPKSQEEERARRQLLKPDTEVGPVVDLRHDYLSVQPDAFPTEQIAVFRGGGADVVAQSAPDFHSDYNSFVLYRLKSGKLRDVTKQLLSVPVRDDRFLYELPRAGTTIRVFSFDLDKQSRKPAFNLLWRGGHFVKVALSKTANR